MRKKSQAAELFIDNLITHIENNVLRQKKTSGKRETEIQRGLYPLIADYMTDYWRKAGYKNFKTKGRDTVYWEGQDGSNPLPRLPVFTARSYPDFIILEPYRIAIEYKQSNQGSLVKESLGQALLYMMSGDYDFAYILFDDQTQDKAIRKSLANLCELEIADRMWREFNIKMQIL